MQARPYLCMMQYPAPKERCVVCLKKDNKLFRVTRMTKTTVHWESTSPAAGQRKLVPWIECTELPTCLTCPEGHCTKPHIPADDRDFDCDVCAQYAPVGQMMYGCRSCDWDVCHDCICQERYPPGMRDRPTVGDLVRIIDGGTICTITEDDHDCVPYQLSGESGHWPEGELQLVHARTR